MCLTWLFSLSHAVLVALLLLIARIYLGEPAAGLTNPLFFGGAMLLAAAAGALLSRVLMRHVRPLIHAAHHLDLAADEPWPQADSGAPRELNELNRALKDRSRRTSERLATLEADRTRHIEILDSITEGILVTDDRGRILLTNRALDNLFGVSQPVAGRLPVEVIRNVGVGEAIDGALAGQQHVSREVQVRGATVRNLDVHVAPILDEGRFVGTVTVLYEITRLRRLERMRADFVANVSHELRTPLTAIKGCAETLADGALSDPQAAERFVAAIESNAERLTGLLNDLLDLSRLESDELEIDTQPHVLRRLVEAARDAVEKATSDKSIDVTLDLPDDGLYVLCDRRLVEQALINLVDNAVKYTPEEGHIRICASRMTREAALLQLAGRDFSTGGVEDIGDEAGGTTPVDAVVIEIIDSGIGIPSDAVDRVFERFFRVDKGRSRAMGGTGLGLSIVRHTIGLHGERVFVDSELERGSTFGFTLPVAD